MLPANFQRDVREACPVYERQPRTTWGPGGAVRSPSVQLFDSRGQAAKLVLTGGALALEVAGAT